MAILLVFDELLAQVERKCFAGQPSGMKRLDDVAGSLGLEHTAVAQLAALFQAQGFMPIGEAARALDCHQRALERNLKKAGITAEAIRMAVRILRAHQRFSGAESLTNLAYDEGFADLAHISRSFKASCGHDADLVDAGLASWSGIGLSASHAPVPQGQGSAGKRDVPSGGPFPRARRRLQLEMAYHLGQLI